MSINKPTSSWNISCLRPLPPYNPLSCRDEKSPRSPKKLIDLSYEEDAQILRVIEAYCTCTKTRYTVNSVGCGPVNDSLSSSVR